MGSTSSALRWLEKRLGARARLRQVGFDIVRFSDKPIPADFEPIYVQLVQRVQPFTATTPERIYALAKAIEYIVSYRIPGDIVECGVWKGGSMMAAALTLLRLGYSDPDLYLFDTFEGMSEPTDADRDPTGTKAADIMAKKAKIDPSQRWYSVPLADVRKAVLSTGYDSSKVHFIKGKVEDTVPEKAPQQISLLRLDTDWYESTKHELEQLFPRLSPQGILIIDDYGHWQGARRAVDEYLAHTRPRLFLNRIDSTGRIGVK